MVSNGSEIGLGSSKTVNVGSCDVERNIDANPQRRQKADNRSITERSTNGGDYAHVYADSRDLKNRYSNFHTERYNDTPNVPSAAPNNKAPIVDHSWIKPIPVRVNGSAASDRDIMQKDSSRCDVRHEDCLTDDVEFSDYVRKRTKRFYVGGFKSSITQEKLISYVERRGLLVTWVNICTSKMNGRVIIRLNVEATDQCQILVEPGFWPRGVKCRPWLSNNRYNNSHRNPGRSRSYVNQNNDGFSEHDQYNGNGSNY